MKRCSSDVYVIVKTQYEDHTGRYIKDGNTDPRDHCYCASLAMSCNPAILHATLTSTPPRNYATRHSKLKPNEATSATTLKITLKHKICAFCLRFWNDKHIQTPASRCATRQTRVVLKWRQEKRAVMELILPESCSSVAINVYNVCTGDPREKWRDARCDPRLNVRSAARTRSRTMRCARARDVISYCTRKTECVKYKWYI